MDVVMGPMPVQCSEHKLITTRGKTILMITMIMINIILLSISITTTLTLKIITSIIMSIIT